MARYVAVRRRSNGIPGAAGASSAVGARTVAEIFAKCFRQAAYCRQSCWAYAASVMALLT